MNSKLQSVIEGGLLACLGALFTSLGASMEHGGALTRHDLTVAASAVFVAAAAYIKGLQTNDPWRKKDERTGDRSGTGGAG